MTAKTPTYIGSLDKLPEGWTRPGHPSWGEPPPFGGVVWAFGEWGCWAKCAWCPTSMGLSAHFFPLDLASLWGSPCFPLTADEKESPYYGMAA